MEKNNEQTAASVAVEPGKAADQLNPNGTTQTQQPLAAKKPAQAAEPEKKDTPAAPAAPAVPETAAAAQPETPWYQDGTVWCWIGGVLVAVAVGAAAGIWYANSQKASDDVNIDA